MILVYKDRSKTTSNGFRLRQKCRGHQANLPHLKRPRSPNVHLHSKVDDFGFRREITVGQDDHVKLTALHGRIPTQLFTLI